MIQIGNTVISAITVGDSTVTRIDVESTQVYPSVQPSIYINLTPTTVLPWNGYYRTGTITVDTNASSWTVEASSTPSGNYFTATKTNSTTVTWTMQANDTTTSRVGYVTVRAGSVSAQTTVYQNAGYVIYIDNQSPAVVNSGATTLAISVWSKYGNEAVPVTYQVTGNDWVRYVSMTDAGGGHYIYNFSIDTNTSTQARYNGVTFTQTQGSSSPFKSASLAITQKAMYVPETIQGFIRYTGSPSYVGDWQVGRYEVARYQPTPSINDPMYSFAFANVSSLCATKNYRITFEGEFTSRTWNGSGYTVNTLGYTGGTIDIPAGTTITIPQGDPDVTVYGKNFLTAIPNGTIVRITRFEVSEYT